MLNNIWTIIKKELKRFFTDKRMLITLFLPGILIYFIYSLMGNFMSSAMTSDPNYTYSIYMENVTDEFKENLNESDYKIEYVDKTLTIDEIKEEIKNKNIDLYLGFEENFIDKVNNQLQPNITIYYNSSSNESYELYNYCYTILSQNSAIITYQYMVNMNPDIRYDLATNEDVSAKMITMMLPYLLLIFLFTGCVAIATESIAGEKERGTIATLLVTPTKRSAIASGKIVALSITSLVSATISFLGLIASLPKLMGGENTGITLSMYGFTTYLGIFLVILVTVIFFTTLLSIVSTFAKNVKEASQWSSMLMVIVMLLGLSSLMGMGNIPTNPFLYLIPVYNSVQCMSSIFALSFNSINFIITILSNILYIGFGIYILTKMFNSEKIMANN